MIHPSTDNPSLTVEPATALDFMRILEWLRDDDLMPAKCGRGVRGLYCDADRIATAWREDRLFVLRDPKIPTTWATPAMAHADKRADMNDLGHVEPKGERVAFVIPIENTKCIYVHPSYRGRGYGTRLMQFMLGYAAGMGVARLPVETCEDDRGFWKRHGFKPVPDAPPMMALVLPL